MFKKWAGWKKVAACLMGAALLMQGGSVAMGATETAKYSSTKAEKSSVKKAAAKDEKEEEHTGIGQMTVRTLDSELTGQQDM